MRDQPGPEPLTPRRFGVDGAWVPVDAGESGALVFRAAGADRYAKCAHPRDVAGLEAERDRTAWLSGQNLPGPRVLDWRRDDAGACLVTSAVPGVSADQVSAADLGVAWPGIAKAVRRLHEVAPVRCPFEQGVDAMVALARDVVARGAVNRDFLPVEQQHTAPEELLARLTPQVVGRRGQEAADLVVCHGDLGLPNIVLDPSTLHVSGFVDLGRLGRADRHVDLALLLASARETWPDERRARAADEVFAAAYGLPPDPDRLRFYLHLDPLTWG